MSLLVGSRVRVTANCRAARLAGRTGAVVSLGRQVELKLDGDDNQLSKVNRNEVHPTPPTTLEAIPPHPLASTPPHPAHRTPPHSTLRHATPRHATAASL